MAAPFKTIQFAANKAQAGDTVDVRGGVYHETVTVPNSGQSGKPIVFQPYNNESVTIDGADPITGWVKSSGSIYTANMPTNLGAGNNEVFVDNKAINEARWPNTSLDLSHPTVATIGSVSGVSSKTATIHDSQLTQPSGFWVGATIHLAAGQAWVWQSGTVTASGSGYVTFSYVEQNATYQAPSAGNHFYLSAVAGALDSAGEWFRASNGKLSIWTPKSDNPASHLVEAKVRQYGFDLSQASYIQVAGFHFFACSINTSSKSTDDIINHVTAKYISQFSLASNGFEPPVMGGIILAGNDDILENSVIVDSAGDGVTVTGSHVTVHDNLIHDVGYAGFDSAGIRIHGYGTAVTYNTVYNAGRDGILYQGNHATVTNNNVYDYGLQTTDLGGFYDSGYNGFTTVVAYNDFHDASTGGYGASGIMFDVSSSGFTIYRNIVWHVNSALRINGNTTSLLVYNNTLDAYTHSIYKDGNVDNWKGVVIENNIVTHSVQYGTNVQASHNISNNGKFVDAAHGNFTLQSGAPAVDTGLVIPPYTNNYYGKAPDEGALELGRAAFSYGANSKQLPTDPGA
jgi:hypothetical protein